MKRRSPIDEPAARISGPAAAARISITAALVVASVALQAPARAGESAAGPSGAQASVQGSGQNGSGTISGRAARWEAERRAKERRGPVETDEPSLFHLIGRAVSPRKLREYYSDEGAGGFGIVLGGRESEYGIQGGVRYRWPSIGKPLASARAANRADVTLEGLASPFGYTAASARLRFSNLFGSSFAVRVDGGYERRRGDDFFGIGPDSLPESEVNYDLVGSRVGGQLLWMADDGAGVGAGIELLDYDQTPGPDAEARGSDGTLAPTAAAVDEQQNRFLRQRLFAVLDRRDLPVYPRAGTYLAAAVERYDERDGSGHDFRRFTAEGRQYFPFLHKRRVIAVRALVELTSVDDNGTIPFYLQPSLGGPDDMRGFPLFRFRGANKLLIQAEYRWEAWGGLDMGLFVDAGQVFEAARELGWGRLRTAYGIGFRFKVQETQLLRIDLANGNEGFATHVSFNRMF